jgi:hypothetical protein
VIDDWNIDPSEAIFLHTADKGKGVKATNQSAVSAGMMSQIGNIRDTYSGVEMMEIQTRGHFKKSGDLVITRPKSGLASVFNIVKNAIRGNSV